MVKKAMAEFQKTQSQIDSLNSQLILKKKAQAPAPTPNATQVVQTPILEDHSSLIAKSIQLAKEQAFKKAHPFTHIFGTVEDEPVAATNKTTLAVAAPVQKEMAPFPTVPVKKIEQKIEMTPVPKIVEKSEVVTKAIQMAKDTHEKHVHPFKAMTSAGDLFKNIASSTALPDELIKAPEVKSAEDLKVESLAKSIVLGESEANSDVESQLNGMFKNIADAAKFLTDELNKEEQAHQEDYKQQIEKLAKFDKEPKQAQLPITPTPALKPTSPIPHDNDEKDKKREVAVPWYKSILVKIGNGFASLFQKSPVTLK